MLRLQQVLILMLGSFLLSFVISGYPVVAQDEDARDTAITLAYSFDPLNSSNRDWIPFSWAFSDEIEMVLVPQGCFYMGGSQNAAQPEHRYCVEFPYWIDLTEVTRAQYARCVASNICESLPESSVSWQDGHPVTRITWRQASRYCGWRGDLVSLPTEAQWEYAARGISGRIFPWGDTWNEDATVYGENSDGQAAVVGNRPSGASWVGALDMSGNAWEWVSSMLEDYPYSANDGREDEGNGNSVRVVRGGSLSSKDINELSAVYRGSGFQSGENGLIGFRCVRKVEP